MTLKGNEAALFLDGWLICGSLGKACASAARSHSSRALHLSVLRPGVLFQPLRVRVDLAWTLR